ncbi:MAG: hypothetical protein NW237_16985 [Cyanobacteriota bacterium]|nr:hypothetical protein [Cyanobacteriota bacterium]
MKLPDNPVDVFFRIRSRFAVVSNETKRRLKEEIDRGDISETVAQQEFLHQVWTQLAQELGLDYQRLEWADED